MKQLLVLALLPLLLPLLLLTSCGEESPEEALRSTTSNFLKASADRNWSSFCQELNSDSQKNLILLLKVPKGKSCPEALEARDAVIGDRIEEQGKNSQIDKVEIKGSEGAVSLKSEGGQQIFPAVLENGEWKLNLFPASG